MYIRLSFLILVLGSYFAFAQQTFTITPKWNGTTYWGKDKKIPYLQGSDNAHTFPDAAEQWAPVMLHQINLPNASEIGALTIVSAQYQPLENADSYNLNVQDIFLNQTQVVVVHQYGFAKKQKVATLHIYPLKYENGTLQKLVQLTCAYTTVQSNNSTFKTTGARSYANNSVLASGTWAKVGVQQEGVYKLTYQDLQNMGFAVSTINPKQIRIYSNGGSMLPRIAGTVIKDDLTENPIVVVGEDDGVFNNQDYILFYGQSPHETVLTGSKLMQKFNVYSDTTFYYLNVDKTGNGLRVSTANTITAPATHNLTTYNAFQFYEKDLYSLIKSGKTMYGESFATKSSVAAAILVPNLTANTTIVLDCEIAHRKAAATATLSVGSQSFSQSFPIYDVPYIADFAYVKTFSLSLNSNTLTSNIVNANLTYTKTGTSEAWLNYIRANYTKNANLDENFITLTQVQNNATGNIHEYTVQNALNNAQFWNVSDPLNPTNIPYTLSGNSAVFKVNADTRQTVIGFNDNGTKSPLLLGKIANQNLHGMTPVDYYIVTHGSLTAAANRLADFHRTNSGITVAVVQLRQIYNEFSSGKADPIAIRDFLKMHYDRGVVLPQNVLMMGATGYSPKMADCLVPIYESENYNNPINSIGYDQFFAALDDVDGKLEGSLVDELDMGVGRFPAKTLSEAEAMVDKVIRYKTDKSGLGNWRTTVSLIADDLYYEGSLSPSEVAHIQQMESVSNLINQEHPIYNIDKIYCDAYPVISTAVGKRRPDVNKKIQSSFANGTLILNYAGHGNEEGIAHERIFNLPDLPNITNPVKMPLMVTATCEFGRYDDPEKTSIGIEVFKKSDGGAIGLFTTTRLVYASNNQILAENFARTVFDTNSVGENLTLGEVYMRSMNLSGSSSTAFMLLGDPAMKLNYPKNKSTITKIAGLHASATKDTLTALTKIRIEGEVVNKNGSLNSSYNGTLYPTIYDKESLQQTIEGNTNFYQLKNIIFKGKTSITAGKFGFDFVVPKDIDYTLGQGKISLYFENQQPYSDGAGADTTVWIGGVNPNPVADNQGPKIDLFMNDENFIRGGLVNSNPILLAKIYDENGINTVGTSIGHDITGKLNDNREDNRILNNYFTYDINSYQQGKVNYQLEQLADGKYSMRVKAWDVFNNSSESTTEFVVARSSELALNHVLNYPNPFTTHTAFWFEHNHPNEALEVNVQIYTLTGKLIKTLNETVVTEGTQVRSLTWDGLDDFGDRIGRGTYLYKIQVKSSKGQKTASQYEKLVILR